MTFENTCIYLLTCMVTFKELVDVKILTNIVNVKYNRMLQNHVLHNLLASLGVEAGIGGFWIPQHRKILIRTPHHRKKSWRSTDTAYVFRFTMINLAYMAFWKQGKRPHVIQYFARTNTGLSATCEIAGKKFLSSRTVIIDRRSQSFLGGSGGIPPENFYILGPQKRSFLGFEWAQLSYSLSTKLLVTFRFIRIMNSRFQCGFLLIIPRAYRNELINLHHHKTLQDIYRQETLQVDTHR